MYRNLPNLLSASRLALAPFVLWTILGGNRSAALALLAFAAASDALDGLLARRLGTSSRLGAYLDPLADKVLLVSVYFAEAWTGLLPAWLVALVFARDLLILGMVGWAFAFTRIRRFPPSIWGKLSTVIQIAVAVIALADPERNLDRGLVYAAVAVTTFWSGLHYIGRGVYMLRAR